MRAKFFVNTKTQYASTASVGVELLPVMDDNPENKIFWQSTPGGKLEMMIQNPATIDFLQVGREYYIDFIQA